MKINLQISGVGQSGEHIFRAPELRTFSVSYLLSGSYLAATTDNGSEMCPTKLTDFCLLCAIGHTQPYRGRKFPQ